MSLERSGCTSERWDMDPFLLKLVLSFVVGGSWIAAVTVLAERHGTKVGGLIGGIPSTVIVTYFFIGWTQGPDQVLQATTIFPLAFSVNYVFFIVYVEGKREDRGCLE